MHTQLVVVGASLGGVRALEALVAGLPDNFAAPLAIVQHWSRDAEVRLAPFLQAVCRLPVDEVEDKQPVEPGRVYIAPADYHTLVDGRAFALSTDAPELYARPSIDALFETAADSYGIHVVGVILTGASADGARGLAHIKRRGGRALVQEPASAECPVMPRAALAAAAADWVLPLPAIAPLLVSLCVQRSR